VRNTIVKRPHRQHEDCVDLRVDGGVQSIVRR
jgi:hypothetical protein